MASENSSGSEQLWMYLPSLPRISVASSSRARLAHRRPVSLFLPSKFPLSSFSQSGEEKAEICNSPLKEQYSTDSLECNLEPPPLSSMPPAAAASSSGGADSGRCLAPIGYQAKPSAAFSSATFSLPELTKIVLAPSVNDDSLTVSTLSAPSSLLICGSLGSAKFCDDSSVFSVNPLPASLDSPALPAVEAASTVQQGTRVEETESISLRYDGKIQTSTQSCNPKVLFAVGAASREDGNSSQAQCPTLQVNVAELNNNLGLESEDSEPEEGQLSGEWSGSDSSVEESSQNSEKKLQGGTIPSLVGEDGLTVAQIAKLSQIQFRSGHKSFLPGCSTLDHAGFQSAKMGTAEKQRKKHKKGEGAKKRAREKSAQKYKEKKKQRVKTIEQPGETPVARLGKGEQRELQNARRNSVENVDQVPTFQAKSESRNEVIEEGEIIQRAQTSCGLLSSLVEAEVGLWTTDDIDDQLVAQMERDVDDKKKKKRGPETAERMLKRKIAKRKKRARKEKELGVRKRRPSINVSKPPVKKLCTYYMKGRCAKGEKCEFSHDAVPLTKQEPCKFLMSHACLKGDDCPFSHDLKAFPCKFFHSRGLCYDGDKCLFSHGPITEEEREKILKRVEKDKERGSNASGLDLATANFLSSLPSEEDPDPLGWGTATFCPSFDVDLPQRIPEAMDSLPNYSGEAENGDLPETSYVEHGNWEISSYSTVDVAEDVQLNSAYHHTNTENISEKLDHVDAECRSLQLTTGSHTTPDTVEANVTPSATEAFAVSLAAPILPAQRLFVTRGLEPKKSVLSLTQSSGSRKLTVESLLDEVLKH